MSSTRKPDLEVGPRTELTSDAQGATRQLKPGLGTCARPSNLADESMCSGSEDDEGNDTERAGCAKGANGVFMSLAPG